MGMLDSFFSFVASLFGAGGKDRHEPERPRPKPLPRSQVRRAPAPVKPKGKPVSPALKPATAPADSGLHPRMADVPAAAPAEPPAPEPVHFLETLIPKVRELVGIADYEAAAARLGCSAAVVEAVAVVESGKYSSWDKNGRPTVLFEPHVFARNSGGRHDGAHVEGRTDLVVSDPRWYKRVKAKEVRYPSNLDDRWLQIRAAYALNAEAALAAVSWGKFQVLGENWKALGYKNIHDFVQEMTQSEAGMLRIFEKFVVSKKLGPAMCATPPDWRKIALRYNGEANVDVYSDLMRKAHAAIVGRNATAPVA